MATYNPADYTTSNKSYGVQSIPSDARKWYLDGTTQRRFASVQEMIDFFPTANTRTGDYTMVAVIGGEVIEYMWEDTTTPVAKLRWGKIQGNLTSQTDLVNFISTQIGILAATTDTQIDDLQAQISGVISGDRGALAPTDPAPTLDGVYHPTVSGVYTNVNPDLTVDLDNQNVQIIITGGVAKLIINPIDLAGYLQVSDITYGAEFETSYNILDPDTILADTFINGSNGILVTGPTAVGWGTYVIPVTAATYTITGFISSPNFIYAWYALPPTGQTSADRGTSTTGQLVGATRPVTANYLGISYRPGSNLSASMMVEGSAILPYEPFAPSTEGITQMLNKYIQAKGLAEDNFTPDPTEDRNAVNKGYADANYANTSDLPEFTYNQNIPNLADLSLITDDIFVQSNNRVMVVSTGWKSFMIPVQPSTVYSFGGITTTPNGVYGYFSTTPKPIAGNTGIAGSVFTYLSSPLQHVVSTSPANATWLVVSFRFVDGTDDPANYNLTVINQGSELITYIPPAPAVNLSVATIDGLPVGSLYEGGDYVVNSLDVQILTQNGEPFISGNNEYVQDYTRKAVAVFTIDDGTATDDDFVEIFDEYDFPLVFALVPYGNQSMYPYEARKSIYLGLQNRENNPCEIVAHGGTHIHLDGTLTQEQIENEIIEPVAFMEADGFVINDFDAPYNKVSDAYIPYLRKYYRSAHSQTPVAFPSTASLYPFPSDPYTMTRLSMETNGITVDNIITQIQAAIDTPAILDCYCHNFAVRSEADMREILDFCAAQVALGNLEVMTITNAINYFMKPQLSDFAARWTV